MTRDYQISPPLQQLIESGHVRISEAVDASVLPEGVLIGLAGYASDIRLFREHRQWSSVAIMISDTSRLSEWMEALKAGAIVVEYSPDSGMLLQRLNDAAPRLFRTDGK